MPFLEPTIPKSETIFIPLIEEERQPRPKKARVTAWDSNPDQLYRSPYYIARYDPLHLPDYRSPYAYHGQKPRRGPKTAPIHLPPLRPNRSERQARHALHEPRQRAERHRPPASETSHSLVSHSFCSSNFHLSHCPGEISGQHETAFSTLGL